MNSSFPFSGFRFQVSGFLLLALLLFAGCGKPHEHDAAPSATNSAAQQKYHCPMHPTYVSDKPGSCPICGMDLVPIEADNASASPESAGRSSITLSPERRQQIGVVTAPVERRNLERTIRATATVEHDETRDAVISPRVGGWVQELYVNYEGQEVEEGQPLFKLYSPDLLVTEREYLNVVKSSDAALIASARRRLELWGISDHQIADLEKTGKPRDTIDLLSPASGHVVMKNVLQGQAFMAGEKLYEIADLSRVWLHTFIYENDISYVSTGQLARIHVAAFPGTVYESRVTFIYPHLDESSRSLEVRLEVDNPDHKLRPDMWATVELAVDLGEGLAIPASAVIDTGTRYITFVDGGEGRIEPRELKISGISEDYYQVTDGVAEGEQVITRALFLVDAESQLKAAIAGMGAAGEHKH